jgi:hypothetical protein
MLYVSSYCTPYIPTHIYKQNEAEARVSFGLTCRILFALL